MNWVKQIGQWSTWLSLLLVLVVVLEVVLRYVFDFSFAWLSDMTWHIFGFLILMSGGFAMIEDKHVRVDVFYSKYSNKSKSLINIIGSLFVLIPWAAVIIYCSFKYAAYSFQWNESSAESGGLPARYVIKFAMTLSFIMIFSVAIQQVYKSLNKYFDK